MAQINVERKQNKNWWIWIIVVIVILLAWWFFMRNNNQMNRTAPMSDSTRMDTVTPMPD
jgi:hypothetical protein